MLLKSTGHVFVLFLQFITGMLLCSIQHTAKKHKKCTEVRAGHAKTLPRQRDRIFRPQKCCLLHYYWYRVPYYRIFFVGTVFRQRDHNIFTIFSGPWRSITLSRCRCRHALKLSRANLSKKYKEACRHGTKLTRKPTIHTKIRAALRIKIKLTRSPMEPQDTDATGTDSGK